MMLDKVKTYAKTVGDMVKNRIPLTIKPTEKIRDVLSRMRKEKKHAGGVVDPSGKLVGLITEREIVRFVFGDARNLETKIDGLADVKMLEDLTAFDMMIASPDTLSVDDDVENAHDIISYFGYRYMPVTEPGGKFAGIVDAREVHIHANARARDIIETKDTLLSYMMHSEPYGIGARI